MICRSLHRLVLPSPSSSFTGSLSGRLLQPQLADKYPTGQTAVVCVFISLFFRHVFTSLRRSFKRLYLFSFTAVRSSTFSSRYDLSSSFTIRHCSLRHQENLTRCTASLPAVSPRIVLLKRVRRSVRWTTRQPVLQQLLWITFDESASFWSLTLLSAYVNGPSSRRRALQCWLCLCSHVRTLLNRVV